MALGSFGESFADAFNQSYKTFREARLEREAREENLAYGRDIAAAYGQTIASPEQEAAAMAEGRTPQAPGMMQKLGLQKPRPTDVAGTPMANFQAAASITRDQAIDAASQANVPGQAIPAPTLPAGLQMAPRTLSGQTAPAPTAALPAPAPARATPASGAPAAPAQDDFVTAPLSPATALKGEGRASLQIPKEFTDAKGRYVTSDQWEKLAVAAAKRGRNAEAMTMFQKAADTKLAAVGTHMATLAANGDYKGLESFLNDIQDGSEAKIVPAPGGGYSFTYGEFKGQTFPSLDAIADFARKVAANDAPGIFQLFKDVASEKIAATIRAEESEVRRLTGAKTALDIEEGKIRNKFLPEQLETGIQANQAQIGASRAATTASLAQAEATRVATGLAQRGGLPKEAVDAQEKAYSGFMRNARTSNPEATPEQVDAMVGQAMAGWYSNTQYGRQIAAAMAQNQRDGETPAPGGIPTPSKPAAKPMPKVEDNTATGALGRYAEGKKGAQAARYTEQWRKEVNPLIQAYRKQAASGTVKREDLIKLKAKIRNFPASIVSQYTTPEDRAFFASN